MVLGLGWLAVLVPYGWSVYLVFWAGCSVVVPVGFCNVGFLCYDCLERLVSCALWLLVVGLWGLDSAGF